MREIVEFTASVSSQDAPPNWQGLAGMFLQPLQPVAIEVSPFGLVTRFTFHRYPQELDELGVILRRLGISASIWVRREYEPDELLAAEYLELRAGLAVDSVVGTLRWDLAPVCPYCGFKETRWDLPKIRIKNRPTGYQLADVDHHPEVVSAMLAHELRIAGFTGVELVPLGRNRSVAWYALDVRHELPPMESPPTRLEFSPFTPMCERNHTLGQTRSDFAYRRAEFAALDFSCTYEIFGDSEATGRAIIISNRVYRLLLGLGVEQLICEPVRLLGGHNPACSP